MIVNGREVREFERRTRVSHTYDFYAIWFFHRLVVVCCCWCYFYCCCCCCCFASAVVYNDFFPDCLTSVFFSLRSFCYCGACVCVCVYLSRTCLLNIIIVYCVSFDFIQLKLNGRHFFVCFFCCFLFLRTSHSISVNRLNRFDLYRFSSRILLFRVLLNIETFIDTKYHHHQQIQINGHEINTKIAMEISATTHTHTIWWSSDNPIKRSLFVFTFAWNRAAESKEYNEPLQTLYSNRIKVKCFFLFLAVEHTNGSINTCDEINCPRVLWNFLVLLN